MAKLNAHSGELRNPPRFELLLPADQQTAGDVAG